MSMGITVNGAEIDYSRLPEHMRDGFMRWIEYGIEPGSFGMAIICNDLFEAFGRADSTNIARMKDIIQFFYNDAPSGCFGSRTKAAAWMQARRMAQMKEAES
jgi:hypothetical protein